MVRKPSFLILVVPLLMSALALSQDQPPVAATNVRVTVHREGSRSGALQGAAVTLEYGLQNAQQQTTDLEGAAEFSLPVDASLTLLRVSYPGFRDVEMPYVKWHRNGTNAATVVVLRDEPPFPLLLRALTCTGFIRQSCAQAEGKLFLYRAGEQEPVAAPILRSGTVKVDLPFAPQDLEVVYASSRDSDVHFFPRLPIQSLPGAAAADLIVKGGDE